MSDLFLQPLSTWRSAVASKLGPKSPVTRHVLLTLGLHMSDLGRTVMPRTGELSEQTNLSKRSVLTHLEIAMRDGWLGRREKKEAGQGWRRMEYFSLVPADVDAAMLVERGEGRSPRQGGERDDQRGEGRSQKVVKDVHRVSAPNISSKEQKKNNGHSAFVLPDWVPSDLWRDFEEMRQRSRKPLTDRARELNVKALEALRAKGHDPRIVMEKSIMNSWAGFYEPKGGASGPAALPWWSSETSIKAKGREVGLEPRAGESWQDFKGRIEERIHAH